MTQHDPFDRSQLPAGFSREDRVKMLAEVAAELMGGPPAPLSSRLYAGGAITGYLQRGGRVGSLERDFLKIAAPARSTMTPARLLASSGVRATRLAVAGTVDELYSQDASNDDSLLGA